MRVVAWNCAGGFARKAPALLDLQPDLAVVSETTEAHALGLENAQGLWTGRPGGKGLALLAFNGWRATHAFTGPDHHVFAAHAEKAGARLLLIGVWTLPVGRSYLRPVVSALDAIGPEVEAWRDAPVLMAGDFNGSPVFARARPPFDRIAARLEALGLKSLWHARTGEAFGAESTPTYFHTWRRHAPFHMDYVFASPELQRRCANVSIGAYDAWTGARRLSDHAPIIADFSPEKTAPGLDEPGPPR